MNIGLTIRKYHRWISTAGAVTILYLSLTGLLVIASQIGNPEATRPLAEEYGIDPPGDTDSAAATLDTASAQQMTRTVMGAVRNIVPEAQPTLVRLQLRMQDGQPQGIVTMNETGQPPRTLAFNALTGTAVAIPVEQTVAGMGPPPGGMGAIGMGAGGPPRTGFFLIDNSQQLHSGAYYGRLAEWLILLTGVGLLALAITGIWMFFDMINRRRKQGRSGWFWI